MNEDSLVSFFAHFLFLTSRLGTLPHLSDGGRPTTEMDKRTDRQKYLRRRRSTPTYCSSRDQTGRLKQNWQKQIQGEDDISLISVSENTSRELANNKGTKCASINTTFTSF